MTEWGVPRQKRIDQQSRYGIRAAVAQDGQTEPGLTDESSKPTVLLVWRHSLGWTPLTIAITPQQVPISIYQEGNICFVKQLDHACRRPLLDQDRSSAGMPWVFARLGSFHVFLSILFMILDLQPGMTLNFPSLSCWTSSNVAFWGPKNNRQSHSTVQKHSQETAYSSYQFL